MQDDIGDIIIDTDNKSIHQVAEEVIAKWDSKLCG
jgi:hypothetical protein